MKKYAWGSRSTLTASFATSLILLNAIFGPALCDAQAEDPVRDTGRYKPVPQVIEEQEEATTEKSPTDSRWFIGVEAGAQGGGDLWHVETASGLPAAAPWIAVTPFNSERFNATLETGFAAGLFVGRRMGEMWSLKAHLASARHDLAAEALQGQSAGVFLYDRLTMTSLVIATEVKMVSLASYPYLSVGVAWNHLSAAREKDLDQDQIGLQLGVGYVHQLSPDFSLKMEARYSRSSFDIGDFVPRTQTINQPVLKLDPATNLNLYGLYLGVQMNL